MSVDTVDHLPAVGAKAFGGRVGEPPADRTVDGDAVVVVNGDQLAEAEGAGERAHLVRDAFHEAAVADEHIGVVVHHVVPGAIEMRGQRALRNCHADRIGETLSERPGSGFDPGGVAALRMSRGHRMQLPEVLDLVNRQGVSTEMQQGVLQHRAVSIGQNESIPIRPSRIRGVVAQEAVPQNLRYVGHTHWHAGMTGVGTLHRVHAQSPNRVGKFYWCGHM